MQATESYLPGFGRFNFVLGKGPTGTAGHIELILTRVASSNDLGIEWELDGDVAADVKHRVKEYTVSYLQGYQREHATALRARITVVRSDPVRINDYERAVYWAIHKALQSMSLPVPPIFAPPDKDEE